MQSSKKNLVFSTAILSVAFGLILNSSGALVFAGVSQSNLRKPDAKDGGAAQEIENELLGKTAGNKEENPGTIKSLIEQAGIKTLDSDTPIVPDEVLVNSGLPEEKKDGGSMTKEDIVHLKANLGANAVLGVSATAVRLAAAAKDMPVYEYIARYLGNNPDRKNFTPQDFLKAISRIMITSNVMNGGKHGSWSTDIQEWMLAAGFGMEMPFWQRLEMVNQTVGALTKIIQSPEELTRILGREIIQGFSTSVGDEGGYTPIFKGNEEALKLMAAAIKKAGYEGKVRIAIDAASSEFFDEGLQKYILKSEGRSLTSAEWTQQLAEWIRKYDIVSTEDIYAENDWSGWKHGFKIIGDKVFIIGDDLTVTNIALLKKAIAKNDEAINSILIKINQNGSISGTIEVIQYALTRGITVAISHRSGETEDSFISHLVIASCLFEMNPNPRTGKMPMVSLKTGGFRRTDRIVKYNEILRIEAELERIVKGLKPITDGTTALSQGTIIPGLSPTVIIDIYAMEIFDSRGNPTTEAFMQLNNGLKISNAVPSGASTGTRESVELRDGEIVKNKPYWITRDLVDRIMPGLSVEEARKILATRVGGKGVQIAVDNVNHLIAPKIEQAKIDVAAVNSLGDLKKFDQVMFDIELALAREESGKVKVNVMGATGDMGPQMANRLGLDPNKVIPIPSARKKDEQSFLDNLSHGIIDNKVAAAQSKVIIPAVDARGLKSAITDNAREMQEGAIIFSVAAPMDRKDGKLVYSPPEGYASAAQMIKAMAPKQKVVVGWQSVPAEWAADLDFDLSHMQLVLMGDKASCEFVRDNVIKTMCKADVAIIDDENLEMAWALESLTPRIIASGKELIVEGGRTLEDLTRFVYEKGRDVTNEEVKAFNRQSLDASLRERYMAKGGQSKNAYNKKLEADLRTVASRSKSISNREHLAVGLKRFAEILPATEQAVKESIGQAITRFKVDLSDTEINKKMPGNFRSEVRWANPLDGPILGVVVEAEEVLKDPGFLSCISALNLKQAEGFKVYVAGADEKQERQLKEMGVEEAGAWVVRDELIEFTKSLKTKYRSLSVGLIARDEKIKGLDTQDMIVYKLKATQSPLEGAVYVTPWKLIFSNLLNKYFVKEASSTYRAANKEYVKKNMISAGDAEKLNDMKAMDLDVPMVPVVDKNEIKQVNLYRDAVTGL